MTEPLPVCYLNGAYTPLHEARISPLDRGFLFADSVYEVVPAFGGRMFRFREHFDRLARSLQAIGLASPHTHQQWQTILEELIRRNEAAQDIYLYVQVTRGMEFGRSHPFPAQSTPSIFAMASPLPLQSEELRTRGWAAITVEDFRWGRCDVKTTALLANVLMKQRAREAGVQEAIVVRDDEVLEGSSMNIFVVAGGQISTPPSDHRILPGITREVVLELARDATPVAARRITLDELRTADEVWLSSSTYNVVAVTTIDGRPVGDGKPGPLLGRMHRAFATLQAQAT